MNNITNNKILPNISNSDDSSDNLISKLTSLNDFYFIVHLIINKFNKNNKNSLIPELAYLLDSKSFTNLITYFEGETITIPTREEVLDSLKLIELYYNYKILGKSWDTSISDTYGSLSIDDKKEIAVKYNELVNLLSEVKKPNIPEVNSKELF